MEILFGVLPMILFLIFWLFMFGFILGGLVLWIWMLVDCISREESRFPNYSENIKIIWILVLVFTGFIGAIIYYFMVKRQVP